MSEVKALKLLEELQTAVSNAVNDLSENAGSVDDVIENLRVALNESLGL